MTSVIVQARGAIIILLQLLESEIPQRDPGMMPGLARAWCPGDPGTDRLGTMPGHHAQVTLVNL